MSYKNSRPLMRPCHVFLGICEGGKKAYILMHTAGHIQQSSAPKPPQLNVYNFNLWELISFPHRTPCSPQGCYRTPVERYPKYGFEI